MIKLAIDERKLTICCMHETHTTSQEVNSPSETSRPNMNNICLSNANLLIPKLLMTQNANILP